MSAQAATAGQKLEGSQDGANLRVGIIVARFNSEVTSGLLGGALEVLDEGRVAPDAVDIAYVPGSFELPLAAQTMARSGTYDAVICLGAIIKHETRHDEFIANAVAGGITQAALDSGVPIVFGVLTTENEQQAVAPSTGDNNRGRDAARTAIEMANLLRTMA